MGASRLAIRCVFGCRGGPSGAKRRGKSSMDRLVWNLRFGLVLPPNPKHSAQDDAFSHFGVQVQSQPTSRLVWKIASFCETTKTRFKAIAIKTSHEFNKSSQPVHLSPEGRATAFPADAADFRFGDAPDRPLLPAHLLGRSTQGGHPIWHGPDCGRKSSELLGWSPLPLLPIECRGSGHVPRIRQGSQSVR